LSQPTVPKASFSLLDAELNFSAKSLLQQKMPKKIRPPRRDKPENLLLFRVLTREQAVEEQGFF